MKKLLIGILIASISYTSFAQDNIMTNKGYVPDAEAAIAIAVAIWNPIYGKDMIEKQKPYQVKLENDVWIVEGSQTKPTPGGVAYIEINKHDGKILKVTHGK